MSTYIHFTEEQKQRAASVDLEEFLRCRGEKLQELRSRTPMGAMPLFMAPEPEELSELAVAAKLEREARRAAAEEQKRKERMERRREEAAAEAEVTSHRRRRRRRGTEDIEIASPS